MLGNGMVIDPKAFFEEADRLMAQGVEVTPERVKDQLARASDSPLSSRARSHERRASRQRKSRHDAARHRSGV